MLAQVRNQNTYNTVQCENTGALREKSVKMINCQYEMHMVSKSFKHF